MYTLVVCIHTHTHTYTHTHNTSHTTHTTHSHTTHNTHTHTHTTHTQHTHTPHTTHHTHTHTHMYSWRVSQEVWWRQAIRLGWLYGTSLGSTPGTLQCCMDLSHLRMVKGGMELGTYDTILLYNVSWQNKIQLTALIVQCSPPLPKQFMAQYTFPWRAHLWLIISQRIWYIFGYNSLFNQMTSPWQLCCSLY